MAITTQQILDAAEALVTRNESPTLAAVRREVGGGSFTTISEALKDWRARRQANAEGESVALPASVQDALAQAGQMVWSEARRQHAAQLTAEREALDAERGCYAAERQEAIDVADQVSRDLERMQDAHDRAQRELAAERDAHSATRTDAHEQRALAESRGRQLEEQAQALLDLHAQISDTAEELGQLKEQRQTLRAQLDALNEASANMEVALKTERERNDSQRRDASKDRREQDATIKALRSQIDQMYNDHDIALLQERDKRSSAETRAAVAAAVRERLERLIESPQGDATPQPVSPKGRQKKT